MTDNGVDQRPSQTALFAALRRTLANKEFQDERLGPDDLAVNFLPPHFRFFLRFKRIRANTKVNLERGLPGLYEYVIARTAYFDHLFKDALSNKVPQIVLLGAGYDSRAYRFAALNQGTRIVELDIAPTQDRKKECLRKAKIEIPKDVTFVPIDFNTDSLEDVLEDAGYQNQQKALFIWEGVSYYLEAESVVETLEFVSWNSHRESVIAFDYTIPLSEENMNEYYGAEEFAQTMKEQHANEELMFSMNEGEISSFLEQQGLEMLDHFDNKAIERTFLPDDEGTFLGQITGHFRFVSASPKGNKG